jgi:predicted signal transduction protein with EAL and GGDEF domain
VSETGGAGGATPPPGPSVLGNVALIDALRACADGRRAEGRSFAVLFIETGIIGSVDAVWGYNIGDAVRNRIAASLCAEVLRPGDPIGDLGRGKFACALSAVGDPSVALLAAEKSLRILNAPLMMGEDEIFARPSIGVAMWPAHGDNPELLLQHARSASLLARGDPEHIAMFDAGRENPETARFLYENRLRSAVSDDTLELLFQPQYDLRLGQIMGAEALLRWRDPRMGLVPAIDAFAAAESAGVVTELVSSLLNRALRNCSEFRYSAGLDLRIGVNLPARALRFPEMTDLVERALRTWSLRPGRLVLEIGETSVLGKDAAARETLAKLKEVGVRLSIDDHALSLSSLFWLAAMPFREIKIDVSAAPDLASAQQPARIMQSLVELGHNLRLDVFAVGAADEAAEAKLKELGCDYVQSDSKAPPLDAQEFVKRYGLA